ncbi:MAG: radical SAM protein [Candidatus Omnitrophica bacterium]|nr:radical SAM protein [Candidatus Omnitrophota bacterium]
MNQETYHNTKPRYCCWVLNYRCMFQCRMCYIWKTAQDKCETTLEEKKRFVDSLVGFVNTDFEFHLSGGEPLVTEGIYDIIRHIYQYGFKINLVTNGWLVDERVVENLSSAGLSSLTFSVDGIQAATHDFLRGKAGSYERIMKALSITKKIRGDMKISVLSLITGHNVDEILPLVDWVQARAELDMISFQAITQPFSKARDDYWFEKEEDRFLWPHDSAKVSRIMDELHARKKNGQKIGNHPNHFIHFKRYFENPNRFLKTIKCNLGDYEFHVDPYGKVFFCCLTQPIGNITTDSLPNLWGSPQTRTIRDDVYHCKQNCHIMINCFFENELILQDEGKQ